MTSPFNVGDIRFEYERRVEFRQGQKCLFSYRITNEGEEAIEGLIVWVTVDSDRPDQCLLDPLAHGAPPFEGFKGWQPTSAGRSRLRVWLGVPDAHPISGDGHFSVYSRTLIADVSPIRQGPQHLEMHFGSYQVGDVAVGDAEVSTSVLGGRRRRAIRQATDGDWVDLELVLRPEETRLGYFWWQFNEAERVRQAGRAAIRRSQHLGDEPEHVEEGVGLLRKAYGLFYQAQKYGRDNVDSTELGHDCDPKLDETAQNLEDARKLKEERERARRRRDEPSTKGAPTAVAPAPDSVPERGGFLRWANRFETNILTGSEVRWGRHSEEDVFLAREPFQRPPGEPESWNLRRLMDESQRNYVRSTNLSRHPHFVTAFRDGHLEIEDRSSRGTWLERVGATRRLENANRVLLAHRDRLHLAGAPGEGDGSVLSLEVVLPGLGLDAKAVGDHVTGFVGRGTPSVQCALIRRLDNYPERSYLLLDGAAVIGRNPDCAIVLTGEGVDERHARLILDDGRLSLQRLGGKVVSVAERDLEKDEMVVLPDYAELRLGEVSLTFRRFAPRATGTT